MNRHQALMQLIEEAHRGEFHFPTSATLAIKIKQTLDDPECHLDAAGKLIQAEPLLAAQVIAIANSVAYNPSGREITDIRTATSRLGFQTLRTMAMAFVARQMSGDSASPEHRKLAAALWEHTANVAALCHVIAARLTKKNPDAALFSGVVHEIGGFYLLSRAKDFPALLAAPAPGEADIDLVSVKNTLTLAVLRNIGVPETVLDALEQYIEGELSSPPNSLGDTVVLADSVSPVVSPLGPAEILPHPAIEPGMLDEILKESAEEVASLIRALKG